MERRRLFLFFAISLAIMTGWMLVVVPFLNRAGNPPKDPIADVVDDGADDGGLAADGAAKPDAGKPKKGDGVAQEPLIVEREEGDPKPPANVDPKPGEEPPAIAKPGLKLKQHPERAVLLGSFDPKSGYFVAVGTTSTGAAVEHFTLNDERYKSLDEPKGPNQPREPLTLVEAVTVDGQTIRPLETAVPQIDALLEPYNVKLSEVEWEVTETIKDAKEYNSSVTYRYVSPDGKLEVQKKYGLEKIDVGDRDPRKVRDSETRGYQLKFDVTIINHDDKPQTANYVLQGPVGLPLENIQHTSIYRSVRNGNFEEGQKAISLAERDVELLSITAADVTEKADEDDLDEWKAPLRYIGVDIQYFAALLIPAGDQIKNPYVSLAQPMLIDETAKPKFSDVSVMLTSTTFNLKPGEEATHSYTLFAGPKRDALLEPIGATDVIEYGWFGVVSKLMLSMMKFMHDVLYLPYGFAIIFLTIIVRGCMYPISRKQAAGAKKMKELQPKIAELKKKYENEKEKFARAQMELFSKHNYNPLAGCLPIVLQLPIFIGLYQALRNAVDLRLTPFPLTWIENLAAPDALFVLPFEIPFGMGSDFNLLPLLTVVLFVVQQKLFMPPPADEQQALQHKMMNFMMIFMGFMFYHVPAGLCVYFIASSLWGIGERKMLDYGKPKVDAEEKTDDVEIAPPAGKKNAKPQADEPPARKGFMQRLFEAADSAGQSSQLESQSNGQKDGNGRGKGKKGKKSRR
jgi:YidC/Oxa1 family membrane protein insertase